MLWRLEKGLQSHRQPLFWRCPTDPRERRRNCADDNEMTKKALGRGLDALISGGVVRSVAATPPQSVATPSAAASTAVSDATRADRVLQVDIALVDRSPLQPREDFAPDAMRELADSIKQRGVIQPLLVRPRRAADGSQRYELIAGERRWRAAKEAGLTTVPVIVREASDEEALEMALVENLQREDLNPIEEARAYQTLATRFHLTQDQIAEKVGKNRATIANAIRLLSLPEDVQAWVAHGQLSVGHAKAILALTVPEEQRLVAERVLRRNLTVRETEQLVEHLKGEIKPRVGIAARQGGKSAHVLAIEERLRQKLGTHVTVRHGRKKGRIEIEYYGNEDLSRLLSLLGIEDL
ncbi:MAG: ParB/RepB/Spo0J family partition protein [Verrucomicrobiae bacterium]|nr:ParB/RepB/Spo0J family partition protein [Verrucomicrobiae bacterium]